MGFVVVREDPIDFIPKAHEMFDEHLKEVGAVGASELKLDVLSYVASRPYALYSDDKLVGYCIVDIITNSYNADALGARISATYIKPEYRGQTGTFLLEEVEKQLKGEVSYIEFSTYNLNLKGWLERSQYKLTEYVFSKELDNGFTKES